MSLLEVRTITVTAFDLPDSAAEALFDRIAEVAHQRSEMVTVSMSGPGYESREYPLWEHLRTQHRTDTHGLGDEDIEYWQHRHDTKLHRPGRPLTHTHEENA